MIKIIYHFKNKLDIDMSVCDYLLYVLRKSRYLSVFYLVQALIRSTIKCCNLTLILYFHRLIVVIKKKAVIHEKVFVYKCQKKYDYYLIFRFW